MPCICGTYVCAVAAFMTVFFFLFCTANVAEMHRPGGAKEKMCYFQTQTSPVYCKYKILVKKIILIINYKWEK